MPRGGARKGAGRKPSKLAGVLKRQLSGGTVKKVIAEEILALIDEAESWKKLLYHKEAGVRLKALMYLTDRRDGKPAQQVLFNGQLTLDTAARRQRVQELLTRLAGRTQ